MAQKEETASEESEKKSKKKKNKNKQRLIGEPPTYTRRGCGS